MCLFLVLGLRVLCQVIVFHLKQTRRQFAQKQTQVTTTCNDIDTQIYTKTVSVKVQTSNIEMSIPVQTNFSHLTAETQTDSITLSSSLHNNPINQVIGTPRPRRLSQYVAQINANRRIPSPVGRGHILNNLLAQGVGRGIAPGHHHGLSNASGRGHMLNGPPVQGVGRVMTLGHHSSNANRRQPMWPLPPGYRR